MKWRQRTLDEIADMICGNSERVGYGEPTKPNYFKYRSSSHITRFFREADTEFEHDGSTRAAWVSAMLARILNEPQSDPMLPPDSFCRVIAVLMDIGDETPDDDVERSKALAKLNIALHREGFAAFYAEDRKCYLKHIGSGIVGHVAANPHRPFSREELERRERLTAYLDKISEDQLIEEVLMPLFRQLGFHRVTITGHKDKLLEYGKDLWMRYTLPTRHNLYFGVQAKRGKLDAAGASRGSTANIAEVHNQVTMMLGHEIFDPETSRRVLIDHALIIAGGEITKAARNWLGNRLDPTKRSQIMFMDRDDILNLFVSSNLALPVGAMPAPAIADDDFPF